MFLYRLAGKPPGPFPNPGFSDVPADHPHANEIFWMVDAGIAQGFGDGTFRPSDPMTRGALAAFLYRLAGSPPGPFPNPGFTDLSSSMLFYDEISWLKHTGIAVGFPDNTFRPDEAAPRRIASVFLYRATLVIPLL